MQFTVVRRGQAIGVTDLGFQSLGGRSRSGDFHPNEQGEAVMPDVACTLPSIRAFLHRDVCTDDGKSIVQPEFIGSRLFADIAEALQHTGRHELTLHDESGAIVPTDLIAIQDTESERSLSEWFDADGTADADDGVGSDHDVEFGGDPYGALEGARQSRRRGPQITRVTIDPVTGEECFEELEIELPNFPRYQIHVIIASDPWRPTLCLEDP